MGDVQSWVAKDAGDMQRTRPRTIAEVPVTPREQRPMEQRLEDIANLLGQCPFNAPYGDADMFRVRHAYRIATGEEFA